MNNIKEEVRKFVEEECKKSNNKFIHIYENHHITGAEIAEKKLKEFGYSEDKIEKIKHCILAHRGSQNIKRESVEAQIIADADAMTHFNDISRLFGVALIIEGKNYVEARKSVFEKLQRTWNKLSPDAKKIVELKWLASQELLS